MGFLQVFWCKNFLQPFELKAGCKKKTLTPPSLTADIQLQLGGAAASLVEGVAAVGARVGSTDGRDGKRGSKFVTPGTGQDVRGEGLGGFLRSKQINRA